MLGFGPSPECHVFVWSRTFVVPIKTKGLNAREHFHAKAKRVKAERAATRAAPEAPLLPMASGEHAVVEFTRFYAGRFMDDDNLPGACKAMRDEVADMLGIDDAPDAPAGWIYRQEKRPMKEAGHVRVTITVYEPDTFGL